MKLNNSRLGLEQEFFLVDPEGFLSHRADEFLSSCWNIAKQSDRSTDCFAPEFVKSIIEINTVPVNNFSELTAEYLDLLQILLAAAKELDLRIYPLSTYPLYATPIMRNQPNYHLEVGNYLSQFKTTLGEYTTTEAQLLAKFPTNTGTISRSDGLALVRYCCDRLEEEVAYLKSGQPAKNTLNTSLERVKNQ